MTYPPGPGRYGDYPYPSEPRPPKKSNTTVIVTIVAVVVLALGALGVTGFAAPGFFLADETAMLDKPEAEPVPEVKKELGPQDFAEQVVATLTAKDQTTLRALTCELASPDVEVAIDNVGEVESVKLAGKVKVRDETSATMDLVVTRSGEDLPMAGELLKKENGWCWDTLSPKPEPDDPTEMPVPKIITEAIEKTNAGDAEGAIKLMCNPHITLVDGMVERKARITLGGPRKDSPQSEYTRHHDLTGTIIGFGGKREKTTGEVEITKGEHDDAKWCISYFVFSPK